MRRTTTGPAGRGIVADRVVDVRCRCAIINDHGRFVAVPEHKAVDESGRTCRTKARVNSRTGDRLAFGFIAVEERWVRPPGEDSGEFPGEVVGVGQAAVHA
jgi:hypothetical protein